MEERIFPRPAVAGALREGFIESRLHMDAKDVPARFSQLQSELSGTVATPTYVVVDPQTGDKLAFHQLTTMASEEAVEEGFLEFLAAARDAAARRR